MEALEGIDAELFPQNLWAMSHFHGGWEGWEW
jgi:hypothetical protein